MYSHRWVCEGTADCEDGSDEAEEICTTKIVDSRCDHETQLRCTMTRGCYDLNQRCDGQIDCSDESDEAGCGELSVDEDDAVDDDHVECSDDNVWKCDSKDQCIIIAWVCDGDKDCKVGLCDLTVLLPVIGQFSPFSLSDWLKP